MTIGGVTIPTSLERGFYLFNPPEILRSNGIGEAVAAGYASVTWTWATMELGDSTKGFTWWYTTLLTGLPSKTFTSASLYNNLQASTNYTNAVVYRPTYEKINGSLYYNVIVEIKQLR